MTILLFIIGCFLSLFLGFKAGVAAVTAAIYNSYIENPNAPVFHLGGDQYKLTKTGERE